MFEADTQTKFLEIRRKLVDLNCIGSFNIDSIDVIESLLNLVEQANKSYKICCDKESKTRSDLQSAQSQLFPLRKEVAKLTKENHALRLNSIRVIDKELSESVNQTESMKVLKNKLVELTSTIQLKDNVISQQENQISSLKHAIDNLKHKSNVLSGSGIKISQSLEYSKSSSKEKFTPLRKDGHSEDSVIKVLRRQLLEAESAFQNLKNENLKLKSDLNRRDNELNRLSQDEISTNSFFKKQYVISDTGNRRIIDQLNGQVDFLNSQLALKEFQVLEFTEKIEILQTQLKDSNNMISRDDTSNYLPMPLKPELTRGTFSDEAFSKSSITLKNEDQSKKKKSLKPAEANMDDVKNNSSTLAALTQEISDNREIIHTLKIELNDLKTEIQSISSQYGEKDIQSHSLSNQIQHLRNVLSNAIDENEMLKKKIKSTETQPKTKSSDYYEAYEKNVENVKQKLDLTLHRVSELESENSNLRNDLSNLNTALAQTELEKDATLMQLTKEKENLAKTSNILSSKESELAEIKFNLRDKEVECMNLHQVIDKIQHSSQPAMSTIYLDKVPDVKVIKIDASPDQSQQQLQMREAEESIKSLKRQLVEVESELERSKFHIQYLESRALNFSPDLDIKKASSAVDSDVQLLQRRLEESKIALTETEERANNSSNILKSALRVIEEVKLDNLNLQTKLENLVFEKNGLENLVAEIRSQLERSVRKVIYDQDEIHQLNQKLVESEVTIQQLKTLNAQTEASLRISSERVMKLNETIDQRENEITELDSTIHQLNETMQDKDKSISSLEENKSHFEAKINYLQKMVDFYVQNEEQYSTHINDLENRLSNLKGIYQRKDNEGRSLLESIEILEQRLKNSDQKFLALNDENTELRKHLKRRQNELDDASNDLKFLTLENQAVTAELATITAERDKLLVEMQELAQTIANLQQGKRSHELELEDMLNAYKKALSHSRQIEAELENFRESREADSSSTKELRNTIQQLEMKIDIQAVTERQRLSQISSLRQQLENINSKLVSTNRNLEIVEADNRKLILEIDSLRQENTVLKDRAKILVKRAAAANEAAKIFQSRLATTENERDSFKSMTQNFTPSVRLPKSVIERSGSGELQLEPTTTSSKGVEKEGNIDDNNESISFLWKSP